MVIYPVANLIRYRIQGVSIIKYYPISGLWGILQKDFKKYGDSLRFFKQVGIEHPDAKSLAINIGKLISVEKKNIQEVKLYKQIGGNIALYLIDPEMIKEFYSLNCYQKSPFIVKMFSRVLGNGFLFDEISHNRKRNIFSKLFHFDNLKQVVPKIEQITQNWVIQKCPLVKKTVQRIDMIDLSQHISGDIITQQFFGINMNNQRYKEKTIPQNLYHLNTATCNQMRTIRYILTGTYTFDKGWCRFDRVVNEDIKNIKQILIDALYSRINKQSQQQKQSQSQEDFQVDTENSIIDQIIKNGYILDKKSSDMSKQEKEELTKSNKILPEELLEEYLTFYLAGMETTGVYQLFIVQNLQVLIKKKCQKYSLINWIYNFQIKVTRWGSAFIFIVNILMQFIIQTHFAHFYQIFILILLKKYLSKYSLINLRLEKSQEKKQISISLMINQLLTKRFHNQIIWIASQKKYLGFMDLPLPLCIEQQKQSLMLFVSFLIAFIKIKATQDHKIKDIEIKKGSMVNLAILTNFYNSKIFKNPEEFNPDRWLEKNQINSYAYLPFSAGRRNCIGQHLGLLTIKIVFSVILRDFEVTLTNPDYQMDRLQKFVHGPSSPIYCNFERLKQKN